MQPGGLGRGGLGQIDVFADTSTGKAKDAGKLSPPTKAAISTSIKGISSFFIINPLNVL